MGHFRPGGARPVSTHSRLKAAGCINNSGQPYPTVSTHSRLKAAGQKYGSPWLIGKVSTHSRLKAAGAISCWPKARGNWFQHTAA